MALIKAGTYVFKDTLKLFGKVNVENPPFPTTTAVAISFMVEDIEYKSMAFTSVEGNDLIYPLYYDTAENDGFSFSDITQRESAVQVYNDDSGWLDAKYKTIIINEDQEITDTSELFGSWFLDNLVTEADIATVSYKGNILSTIKAGETLTLQCENMRMEDNLAITIGDIQTASMNLQNKAVYKNGVVVPDAGYDGMSRVTVSVPIPDGYIKPTSSMNISENNKEYDVTAYASVNVQIPISGAKLQEKTFTENKTFTPDSGYDGFSKVTVNVPETIPTGYLKPSGTKTITTTGEHDVAAYEKANVQISTSLKTAAISEYPITSNGSVTINTPEGFDAISSVQMNVNVQPKLAALTGSATTNGKTTINTPDGFDGISSVELTVAVPTVKYVDNVEALSTLSGVYDGMIAVIGMGPGGV